MEKTILNIALFLKDVFVTTLGLLVGSISIFLFIMLACSLGYLTGNILSFFIQLILNNP